MSTERLQTLLRSLRHAAGLPHAVIGDDALLDRWLAQQDELAFEVLVWRHGPMVLGVCQRLLRHAGDVEDAFQATFLTLVRQGRKIRDKTALAGWLHRVAHRIALRARRPSRESSLDADVAVESADSDPDLRHLLDGEIDRLPGHYRRAVVLCWLQGHTLAEAARLLGIAQGTLSSHLSRGRSLLQRRLSRQGLDPRPAAPTLSASLVGPTLSFASCPHDLLAGMVPARVAELSSGVITEMSRQKLLSALTIVFAFIVLLAAGLPFLGALLAGDEGKTDKEQPEPAVAFSYLAVEPFNGKFRLNWKPVRPEEKYVSLTKNKGKLTITTQQGTIHADETTRGEPKAKNIYLIDNPLADDIDFEVLTCISNFTPQQTYQQAALICYDDDDNYIKWSYEFNWPKKEGACLCLVREARAESKQDRADVPADAKKVWLRLTRRKGEYEYASSGDGKKWTVHGQLLWGEKGPAKIGILAKNGGVAGVPEVDVCFELFQLRSPPPAAAKKE